MSGDLISRQAAIGRINKQREHLRPDLYPQDKIGDGAYRICAEFIGRLPSAERHGRWKETKILNLWECSVCGRMIYSETVLDRKTFHKWCGRCGAKMDEVDNENPEP